MKACSKCGEHKPLSAFYRQVGCRDGVRPNCIACVKSYRRTNADRIAAASKARRLKAPEKIAATKRAYREKNPEKVRAYRKSSHYQNHERELERNRAWKRANKSKVQASIARRMAAKLQATVNWTNKSKIEEFYFAADFLGMVTGDWYHVDHIVPLQGKTVCGLHCESNLQVILGSENQSKSNRFWPDMPGQI